MTFENVSIVCEGPTESDFVKKLNKGYFNSKNISLKPIVLNKSRAMDGNVSLDRLVYYISRAEHRVVTTLVDYYGFKYQRGQSVEELETQIRDKSGKEHIIPYLQMHETEALWFSDIEVIKEVKNANITQYRALKDIEEQYSNPEDINNSCLTAPSKRLESIFLDYKKIIDGNIIANRIPIETIKAKCPRFSNWLNQIEEKVNQLRNHN